MLYVKRNIHEISLWKNFANILLNQETRILIRNIENIEKKLINCQLDVIFNKTCLNEDILHIYTHSITYTYIYSKNSTVERLSCN